MAKETENKNIKTIHHHLANASKVTMLFAVAAFVGVIILTGYVLIVGNKDTTKKAAVEVSAPKAAESVDNTELVSQYQKEINGTLSDAAFSDSGAAGTAAVKILDLRVPAEFKQMHLEIVVALKSAQSGNYEEAQAKINSLKSQYAWMSF